MAEKPKVIGRGRGRGRGAFVSDVEKRPGHTSETSGGGGENSVEKITASLSKLTVESDTAAVVQLVQAYGASEEQQQEVMNKIYAQCQKDWHFAEIAAKVCNKLVCLKPEGPKFRIAMLRVLQADFKKKDELRESNPAAFLGCLAFLCQIFSQIKTATDEPYLVLINSVLDALEMLLDQDATDEEIEVAITQLRSVGELLQTHEDKENKRYTTLLKQLRGIILDSRGARESRMQAIEIVYSSAAKLTF